MSSGPGRLAGSIAGADRRTLVYALLTLALVLFAFVVHRVSSFTGPALFTLSEVAATVLAFVVGALALVRFYSRKSSTYLYIGTGFFGTGFLELYHVLITSPFIEPGPDLPVWTWIASRAFLSLFLLVSWLAWYRESREGASEGAGERNERSVYLTAAFLTVVIFLFFTQSDFAPAYHPDRLFSRPAEFVPAFFFGLALVGYLTKGDWRREPFEHWLIIALLISVFQHAGILAFAAHPYDGRADAAHLLKVASYACVLVGLMASFYVTFRREQAASDEIVRANAALAREVEVRREAERVLQESEERLHDFLEHAHDLILTTDLEGRIRYANEAWRRTVGYGEDELAAGLNIYDLLHPDSLDSYRGVVERVFRGEPVSHFEVRLVARDGRSIRCSGGANARFEGGRPISVRSILRDVTEEVQAREELAASRANLEALFESTGDAIWSVDEHRRLITFNTAFALTVEAIVGREPVVGEPMGRWVPEGSRAWFAECFDRALAGTRFSAVWEESVEGDGRSFELYFNPIQAGSGVAGVVVFSKDITRRLHVEEALRRAKREAEEGNQAKSHFMASMSHELRTPLNSVIGFANILVKDKEGRLGPREKEFLERILANGKHLLHLINEVLDLSKIEAGRMELDLEVVEVGELVRDTMTQLGGQAAGRPVEVIGEIPEGLQPIQTDPGKLKQVLINLVGNALKFTEEGSVTIRVGTALGSTTPTHIEVEDTGPGIPEERLDAIFEAFQQGDGGTSRRYGGTGLGLAISRSLCELMNYRLSVSSTMGAGSTFRIQLGSPTGIEEEGGALRELGRPPRSRWAAPAADGGPRGMSDRTVLVVDDEEDSRTLIRHYLEEVGCRVFTASDGVEGLEVARKERPDLITLDLMMPRMSGWEMLRAIRDDAVLRNTPVIVVSIVAEEGSSHFLGAVDLLNKPVDRDEFLEVLRRNLFQQSGRVLIVEPDPDTRHLLQRYLKEAGLVPHVAESGREALELLAARTPELILLDLLVAETEGPDLLPRLRAHPRYAEIPVVVLTANEPGEEEQEYLSRQSMEVIVTGGDAERRLRKVLDRLFGRPGSAGSLVPEAAPTDPGSPGGERRAGATGGRESAGET